MELNGRTPVEVRYGAKPDLARVWGAMPCRPAVGEIEGGYHIEDVFLRQLQV